jgi:hypothetical protein
MGGADSAFFFLRKSLAVKEKSGSSLEIAFSLQNMAKVFIGVNKLDSAEKYLNMSIVEHDKKPKKKLLFEIYHQYCRLYISKEKPKIATSFWDKANNLANEIKKDITLIDFYDTGIALNKKLARYDIAFKMVNLKEKIRDSLYWNQRIAIKDVFYAHQVDINNEEKKLDLKILAMEKTDKYFYIIVVIMLAMLAIVLFYLWMKNRKAKMQLIKLTEEKSSANEALKIKNAELNNSFEEITALNEKLNELNNRVGTDTSYLEESINEYLKGIEGKYSRPVPLYIKNLFEGFQKNSKDAFNEFLRDKNATLSYEESWYFFEQLTSKVHPKLMTYLKNTSLNTEQLKVTLAILLHPDNADRERLAIFVGKSPFSVDKYPKEICREIGRNVRNKYKEHIKKNLNKYL